MPFMLSGSASPPVPPLDVLVVEDPPVPVLVVLALVLVLLLPPVPPDPLSPDELLPPFSSEQAASERVRRVERTIKEGFVCRRILRSSHDEREEGKR